MGSQVIRESASTLLVFCSSANKIHNCQSYFFLLCNQRQLNIIYCVVSMSLNNMNYNHKRAFRWVENSSHGFFSSLKKTNKHTQEHNKHNAILVHFWEYLIRTTQHKSILKLHNKFIPFKNSLGFKSKQKLLSDREIIELQLYARILPVTKNHAILCCQSRRGSSRIDSSCAPEEKNKNTNIFKPVPAVQALHTF